LSNSEGILLLDKQLKMINQKSIDSRLDLHGVAIKNDKAYIVETGINSIGVYDLSMNFKKINEILFTKDNTKDVCHINDICIFDNNLIISMFTNPVDLTNSGVILEYSLERRKLKRIIFDSLAQPHSVIVHNNQIYYCDSAKFSVNLKNEVIFKGLGYIRGLAIQHQTMLIGQSKSRHIEELLKDHQNILFECGVYVHDISTKLSSFITLPSSEVYGILVI
jgi:hypothetical protein